MEKPYIICHMVTSLDGKVTGDFLGDRQYGSLIESYYRIHRQYEANGFLCGRVTMEESFPQPAHVQATTYDNEMPVSKEDHVAKQAPFYAVSIDPKGKLFWSKGEITDIDEGYNGAHLIEILTHNVSGCFLEHLQEKGVSYLFGGKSELDLALIASKLKNKFGIEKLLLEGGGIVNGAFLQANLIDEISLVVAPVVGSPEATSLFATGHYSLPNTFPASFHLKKAEQLDNSGLWLVYQK
ncbi:RibD family protein [uncultured Anaeromusa sp.]|uniref:RibD family protein n=1 Tax=uncultured Anaeromusa sp. TaxID=673273 RepID=UPI0029C84E9F|nr:RibD family protein [uncultured Anaeromusa sp.]